MKSIKELRKLRVYGLLTGLAVCATAMTLYSPPHSTSSGQSIRIATYSAGFTDLPSIIAKEKGYFTENGLDVAFTNFQSAPEAAAALYGNSLDLLPSNGLNQILTNERSNDPEKRLVQVFGSQMISTWEVIMGPNNAVDDSLGLEARLKLLKGKTMGIPAVGSDGHHIAQNLLEYAGLQPNDVKFLAVGLGPQAMSAFQAGKIDAVIALQPVTALLKANGGTSIFDMATAKEFPNLQRWPFLTYLSTISKADERPELMRSFQKGMDKAISFLRNPNHAAEAAGIWSTYNTSMSTPELQKVIEQSNGTFTGNISCPAMSNAAEMGKKFGLITGVVPNCRDLVWQGASRYIIDE